MNAPQSAEPVGIDKHDAAGMSAWLRERERVVLEFMQLSSEEQIRTFLQDWQRNVLPHLAFRFRQAAEMIEQLDADAACEKAEKESLRHRLERIEKLAAHGEWEAIIEEIVHHRSRADVACDSFVLHRYGDDGLCAKCWQPDTKHSTR